MKKKLFNRIMFWISIVYLLGAIIIIVTGKIKWDITNLFNTDGLSLLGCIFAVGELILSKRNIISKCVNQMLISNKLLQYRIGMVLELEEQQTIKYWINTLENNLRQILNIEELPSKTINEIKNDSCKIYYETCGFMIDYYKNKECLNIRISGKAKYGKLHSKKKDIMYLSLLIEMLSNGFLQDNIIRRTGTVKSFELTILKNGSQLSYGNIFNDELGGVNNYSIAVGATGQSHTQYYLSDEEVTMRMINVTSIYDGFIDFTNLLCSVE
ncbi:MAG: hypothetical protein ACLR6T_06955 [Intestinibacter sp.]